MGFFEGIKRFTVIPFYTTEMTFVLVLIRDVSLFFSAFPKTSSKCNEYISYVPLYGKVRRLPPPVFNGLETGTPAGNITTYLENGHIWENDSFYMFRNST